MANKLAVADIVRSHINDTRARQAFLNGYIQGLCPTHFRCWVNRHKVEQAVTEIEQLTKNQTALLQETVDHDTQTFKETLSPIAVHIIEGRPPKV